MNLGMGEVMVILIIAFVVVGPKDLPKIARFLARGVKQVKSFYGSLKETMNLDEELAEVKQAAKDVKSSVETETAAIQAPAAEINSEILDIRKEIDRIRKDRA